MDTLGALALATEPPNDDLMKRLPVGRRGNFISNVMWRNILGQSIYQFVIIWYLQTSGKSVFHLDGSDSDLILNTLIFNSFVFCQVRTFKCLKNAVLIAYPCCFRILRLLSSVRRVDKLPVLQHCSCRVSGFKLIITIYAYLTEFPKGNIKEGFSPSFKPGNT